MTAHAPPRTRNNNPAERTTAARASGSTRARSCPHRWTRRISEGQETNRRGTRQGQSLRARLPKLGSRRPGLGSRRGGPWSGIAGRADAGTQARQFNATPTPATALHAIPDHGPPRPLRQPGLQLARGSRGHCCRDDPHALRHAGAASTLARAWQMNARHTPRRGSPSAPNSLWATRSSGRKRDRCTPGVPQLGNRRPGLGSGHVTP